MKKAEISRIRYRAYKDAQKSLSLMDQKNISEFVFTLESCVKGIGNKGAYELLAKLGQYLNRQKESYDGFSDVADYYERTHNE